jgi:hypothetical protein
MLQTHPIEQPQLNTYRFSKPLSTVTYDYVLFSNEPSLYTLHIHSILEPKLTRIDFRNPFRTWQMAIFWTVAKWETFHNVSSASHSLVRFTLFPRRLFSLIITFLIYSIPAALFAAIRRQCLGLFITFSLSSHARCLCSCSATSKQAIWYILSNTTRRI